MGSSYCFLALLCVAILNPIGCNGESKQENVGAGDKRLFVFGDSRFDAGNNLFYSGEKNSANDWPYGLSINHATGRFSDGLLVPDFIALFANLRIPRAYLDPVGPKLYPIDLFKDGANFASAGGRVMGNNTRFMNLAVQLSYFKEMVASFVRTAGDEATREILMRSVYLFSFGTNDYVSFNTNNPNASPAERKAYVDMVIGNLTSAIGEIYQMGGRKFAFQNVGPLGCYPIIRANYPYLNGRCAEWFSNHAKEHNEALSVALRKMERSLTGFKHSIFYYYHELEDRLSNPKAYGFKVGAWACCGDGLYNAMNCGGGDNGDLPYRLCSDPNEYVMFDGGHHTQATNKQLAQLFWGGPPSVTGPHTVKQLFEYP